MASATPCIPLLVSALLLASEAAPARAPEREPQTREEHFLIEEVPQRGDGLRDPLSAEVAGKPIGRALLRRMREGGRVQLEWEIAFDDGLRLLEVERQDEAGMQLSWRDLGAPRARTLRIEWPPEGGPGRMLEWSGERRIQAPAPAASAIVLPLELIERLRQGALPDGERLQLLDPLKRGCDPLLLAWKPGASAGARLAELLREDRTCAGRYLFGADGELQALQWQAGSLRARRVDAAEYEKTRTPVAER